MFFKYDYEEQICIFSLIFFLLNKGFLLREIDFFSKIRSGEYLSTIEEVFIFESPEWTLKAAIELAFKSGKQLLCNKMNSFCTFFLSFYLGYKIT